MNGKINNEDEIIEGNDNSAFLTEYQVINQWRISLVSHDFTMTYIFIPLSISVMLSYFLIKTSISPYYFFGFSFSLIVFWRWYAYHIDSKVFKAYTRILKLEEKFRFHFTREYLESVFWKKKELKLMSPTWLGVREKVKEIENRHWIIRCYFLFFHYRYSRGHLLFNCLALAVILIEWFLIKNIIPRICLRGFLSC